jgi:hypothetical protein
VATPSGILAAALRRAVANLNEPTISQPDILQRIIRVSRNASNRAGVRVLLACSLAKVHDPLVDIRKPYTEIGDPDAYSGRTIDEAFVTEFINQQQLPCNPTTAWLTPALRNRNMTLTPDLNLVGRPPDLYRDVLQLLDDVHQRRITAEQLLTETIRQLLIYRDERRKRLESLLSDLKTMQGATPLSAESIVALIQQHLVCKNASRLPVLVVAAAYHAAETRLEERVLPLHGHNAADEQTGALGDLEITLVNDVHIVTGYEMKTRRVTQEDIERAIQKIEHVALRVDHYIFITTEPIEESVQRYAVSMYERTGGIEFVVLDCVGFLRHFLHLFHRLRMQFLDEYQNLVLSEPESSLSQPLKEAFLALRQAAESG